jgi:hypothetical protein
MSKYSKANEAEAVIILSADSLVSKSISEIDKGKQLIK